MQLSNLAKRLKPSATVTITSKAKALRAEGIDVIGFGAGEPDFDTPENIKQSGINAIQSGFTKYTAPGGIDKIKEAIIGRIKADYGIEYEKPEIIVSCGAKHTLYNLTQVLINDGDEVIIPAPYWVTYPEQVSIAGGTPVIIDTDERSGFKISASELEKVITKNTKALILNYPSNPTGSTYTKGELESIVGVALDAGLIIITDEIYDKIIYGGTTHTPIPSLSKRAKENSILVNGVSKAYSM
nr:aminotransferase class I/II-fold pyridoxal phosphate-dependent enzyme [Candidatus Dadabacteria bacterium]